MATELDAATQSMIANLKAKTGRSLEEWVALISARDFAKHAERVNFLKAEHGLSHGYANLVAHSASKSAASTMDDRGPLLDAQYNGAKAALRPVYDALEKAIKGFGTDVELLPMKSYVSVRRKKQFAILQPSTADRFDVGINLKGTAPTGRLEASGNFSGMVSHRVRLAQAKDVDKELLGWLRAAYEQAG